MTDYETQARDFLDRFGITLNVSLSTDQTGPDWADDGLPRNRYRVTMTRDGRSYTWDWWNSAAATADGSEPTAYDVLAGERAAHDLTADDVYEEFGAIDGWASSRYETIAAHAREMAYVLGDEDCIDALHEIQ